MIEGSFRSWDLYTTGQLVDALQKKKKKKENQFSLNGNGIISSFLGWEFYRSTLYIYIYIYIYIYEKYIESIESFENSRMQYSAYKRLIRKGEQGPAPGPQSHHTNCAICGKLCLSLAGLKSHLRKCAKSITEIMSLQAKLNGCANFVVKSVAAWLAGRVTYEHIKFKGGWGGGRGHETKEVVTLETERTAIIYIYI